MSTPIWIYPTTNDCKEIRVEGQNKSAVEHLLWGLRFRQPDYYDPIFDGSFNFRAMRKISYKAKNDNSWLYDLKVHPTLQNQFDTWENARRHILKMKKLYDYPELADDYNMSHQLRSFQRIDAKLAFDAGKFLFLQEPGTGKTPIACAA